MMDNPNLEMDDNVWGHLDDYGKLHMILKVNVLKRSTAFKLQDVKSVCHVSPCLPNRVV